MTSRSGRTVTSRSRRTATPQPQYGEPQPPYGDQRQPQPPYGEPQRYPQQELLPQQVQPGRSRLPLILGAVAVVAALVVALVVWRVVHDDGEDNRAAYCNALKKVTTDGLSGLTQDLGNGAGTVPKAVTQLVALAPDSVRTQWDDLVKLASSGAQGSADVSTFARVITDVQAIIADANSECGLDLRFPS